MRAFIESALFGLMIVVIVVLVANLLGIF